MKSVFYVSNSQVPPPEKDSGFTKEGWYWIDKTWANMYGPYSTREAAEKEQLEYVIHCLGVTSTKEEKRQYPEEPGGGALSVNSH